MNVVIYARVSTDDKDQNPERQRLACVNYAEIHNHKIIHYCYDKITGDSNPLERKGFKEVLKFKPDGILFFEISRFSREHPIKVMRRLQDLKNKGIKTISITEQAFNMEGEMSDLIQYIMTWINNYFLANLKRNINSGLDRARKEGKILGRPKSKVNHWEVYRLRNSKNPPMSLRAIAKEMKISLGMAQRCIKKVQSENPDLFINKPTVSNTGDL